jgi:hypothetical protein
MTKYHAYDCMQFARIETVCVHRNLYLRIPRYCQSTFKNNVKVHPKNTIKKFITPQITPQHSASP